MRPGPRSWLAPAAQCRPAAPRSAARREPGRRAEPVHARSRREWLRGRALHGRDVHALPEGEAHERLDRLLRLAQIRGDETITRYDQCRGSGPYGERLGHLKLRLEQHALDARFHKVLV